jgi:sugar phosphate isomerase/epimerase
MGAIQYCLNASTIKPAPLMDKIRIAGNVGFKAIELWNDELTDFVNGGGTLADVVKALGDAGLKVPTVIALHGWLGSQGGSHAKAIDEAKRRIAQAAEVGAPRIIASPPIGAADLSQGGVQYRELLEIGANYGVKPAMEFLGFVKSVHTIEQAWQIVCDANHPHGSIVMDPFHILRGGGSYESIAKVPGTKVAIWHWNDCPGTRPVSELSDSDRVLPGDGVGPLKEMERLIRDSGYSGYVSLELFNPSLWARDPEEVARIGLEKMQAYFSD